MDGYETQTIAKAEDAISGVERKNGLQLAEQAGYQQPRSIQRVLDRSIWDAQALRDDLRAYVVDQLGEAEVVLVIDETGSLKQVKKAAGVKRQYSGTAGIDCALSLPQEWIDDPERRTAAGIPEQAIFQTKPQLALVLLERTWSGAVPAAWVTADEVYGNDGVFRRALEARGQAYVLAVKRTLSVTTWPAQQPIGQHHADALLAAQPPERWQRLSCGEGAQGERLYDWGFVVLRPAARQGWVQGLLGRRSLAAPEDLAYYLVHAPEDTHRARGRVTMDD